MRLTLYQLHIVLIENSLPPEKEKRSRAAPLIFYIYLTEAHNPSALSHKRKTRADDEEKKKKVQRLKPPLKYNQLLMIILAQWGLIEF